MPIKRLAVPAAKPDASLSRDKDDWSPETPEEAAAREAYRQEDMLGKQPGIPDAELDKLIAQQRARADALDPVPGELGKSNWTAPSHEQAEARATGRRASGASRRDDSGETKRRDLFQEVTDKMIQAIEEGTAPWQQPWRGRLGWPENPTTGKPYHGINVLLLSNAGYQDPRWCSYEQAKKSGWQVRSGEKASRIYFYKPLQKETGELDPATALPIMKLVPVFRSYPVFNLSQIDNVPKVDTGVRHETVLDDVTEQTILEIVEAAGVEIVEAAGVEIVSGRTRAAYSPKADQIVMPAKDTFKSDAHYYAALLHELAHWTGHESRLNRAFSFDRNSASYAREELRAEMASAMLSMQLGIPAGTENHEGYVAEYLKLLRGDKKEIFRAAKDAETISRFILRYSPEHKVRLEDEVREQAQAATDAGSPDEFFDASLFDDFEAETPGLRP